MEQIAELIKHLPEKHRAALNWFITNAGTYQPWPKPLPDGTLLASRAQGIYKPSWTKYGLSVRQNIAGPYSDQEPVLRSDGTWFFLYSEESTNPNSRDSDYANRSLVKCLTDQVPIGVIRQVSSTPESVYHVLGVALVAGRQGGYFLLEGFSVYGWANSPGSPALMRPLGVAQEHVLEEAGVFDPASIQDARERTIGAIVRRRGQPDFRRRLLEAYGGKCAITGCDAVEALEAVHIIPYRGPDTDHISNGLLLRADMHTLFDLGLLAIDTTAMTVLLASSLMRTTYGAVAGRRLKLPKDELLRPSREALDQHRGWSGL